MKSTVLDFARTLQQIAVRVDLLIKTSVHYAACVPWGHGSYPTGKWLRRGRDAAAKGLQAHYTRLLDACITTEISTPLRARRLCLCSAGRAEQHDWSRTLNHPNNPQCWQVLFRPDCRFNATLFHYVLGCCGCTRRRGLHCRSAHSWLCGWVVWRPSPGGCSGFVPGSTPLISQKCKLI